MADTAKAVLKPNSIYKIGEVAIEVYFKVDETELESDALIATIAKKGKWTERLSTPLNVYIKIKVGNHYHDELKKVDNFEPLTAAYILGDRRKPLPAFKDIIFVNGVMPMAEVMTQALRCADEEDCRTVVLPMMAFTKSDAPLGNTKVLREIAGELELAVGSLALRTVKTIKLVYPS